jgi:hypothetical protein
LKLAAILFTHHEWLGWSTHAGWIPSITSEFQLLCELLTQNTRNLLKNAITV